MNSDPTIVPPRTPSHLNPWLTGICWAVLGAVLLAVSAAFLSKSAHRSGLPVYGRLPEFQLMERSGRTVRSADLKGKVWIADFIFTRCAGPCPVMTSNMARLQQELRNTPDLHLVSFSVDPEFDTPEVLVRYAQRFQAGDRQWLFLTGNVDMIRKIAEGFKITMARATGTSTAPLDPNAILHDTHFMLVDRHGQIRGYYESVEPDKPRHVAADALALLKEDAP